MDVFAKSCGKPRRLENAAIAVSSRAASASAISSVSGVVLFKASRCPPRSPLNIMTLNSAFLFPIRVKINTYFAANFRGPVSVIMAPLERRGLQSRDLALLRNDLLLDTLVSTRACTFNLRAGLAANGRLKGGVPVLCEPRHGRFGSQVVFAELHMTPVRALAEMMVEGRLCQQIDGPASGPAID
jgi:hypothetical protein